MASDDDDEWDANEVFDRVFVGAQDAADSAADCKRAGITHVVSLREGDGDHNPIPLDRMYAVLYSGWLSVELMWIVLRYEWNTRKLRAHAGLRYCRFWIADDEAAAIYSFFGRACRFIHAAHQANPNNRVLIHCAAGMSRSATIATAYALYRHTRLHPRQPMPSVADVIQTLQRKRPIIKPNAGFVKQLGVWRKQLHAAWID